MLSDAFNKSIGKRDEPGGGKQDKMDAREPVRGELIPPASDFGHGATWLSATTHKQLCPGSAPQKSLPSGSRGLLCAQHPGLAALRPATALGSGRRASACQHGAAASSLLALCLGLLPQLTMSRRGPLLPLLTL